MAVPLATNLLHFHLNKLFKNVFCILAFFVLVAVLATFQKIGQFFPNHLVTLFLTGKEYECKKASIVQAPPWQTVQMFSS
jgi:hypothetical protein